MLVSFPRLSFSYLRDTAMQHEQSRTRKASCMCGELRATAAGDPSDVYICSCLDCQKLSGSAFSYCAVYPEDRVTCVGGRSWRYCGDSSRWLEVVFCPNCGGLVYYRIEAYPGTVVISAGCFADPDFPKPDTHYYASRRHPWLKVPDGVEAFDEQGDVWGTNSA